MGDRGLAAPIIDDQTELSAALDDLVTDAGVRVLLVAVWHS